MTQPVIISVATTGAVPCPDNPAVPMTPQEQIESTHEAFEAGAPLTGGTRPACRKQCGAGAKVRRGVSAFRSAAR